MFYNFLQLKSELLNRLKTNNNAVSDARRGQWLNNAQDNLSTEMDPDHLIKSEVIVTEANRRSYVTKHDFNKIISVIDVAGNLNLTPLSEGATEFLDPNQNDQGGPLFYYTSSLAWIFQQPNIPTRIKIISSAPGDISQKIRINGIVNDVEDTELLTLSGTTEVVGQKLFSEIHSTSKDSVTTGKVTVYVLDYPAPVYFLDSTFILDTSTLSGPAEDKIIAEYGPQQLAHQRQPIFIWPTPDQNREILVRGIRRPRVMVNNEDFPDYPEAYHELILIDATIRGHQDLFRPQMAEQVREKEWKPFMEKLKAQMGNKRGKVSPVLRGQTGRSYHRGGRLPNNYPQW